MWGGVVCVFLYVRGNVCVSGCMCLLISSECACDCLFMCSCVCVSVTSVNLINICYRQTHTYTCVYLCNDVCVLHVYLPFARFDIYQSILLTY